MFPLVLDLIYLLALVASSPIWLYRMVRHGRYQSGWAQRFGATPIRYSLQPRIWIHGVSLGEINVARTLVAELHSQLPDYQVMISSTTDTGMAAARRLFEKDHVVFQWPLDFSFSVARALRRTQPDLVVLMEGEAWPNFLAACNRRDIPAVIVNGRLGADKGYPRYKKLGPLAARLFNRLRAIGVQEDAYARRFEMLGVDQRRLHVTGMMKFDSAYVESSIDGADDLAHALGISPEHKLVVAGGTGPGEEELILGEWTDLSKRHPLARLAIVPRKSERFDEVARLITECGFNAVRRSEKPDGEGEGDLPANTVILGDTMGELRKFYSLAECVFVGRSLVPMGGSDMIEAAALAKATAFGPHTFNFPQADGLAKHGCVRVADVRELVDQLSKWLTEPVAAAIAGKAARTYVCSRQGATRRNVEMICGILGRVPAVSPGAIATEAIKSQPSATR